MTLILVGIGGAAGSVFRYLLSTVPVTGPFPLTTLTANFLGAVFIGALAGLSSSGVLLPAGVMPLFKTGFCGGFTTFSTFSLETVTLLEQRRYAAGCAYAALSLSLCLAGVILGKLMAERLCLFLTAGE